MKGFHIQKTCAVSLGLVALLVGGMAATATEDQPRNEDELIRILRSGTDWQATQQACRELRHVGTEKCIPVLSPLLTDETLSHMARYALEPIPSRAVDEALRDALSKTSGESRMGIIISLGARGDRKAVPLLVPLLNDSDKDTVRATAGALGRIATPDAVEALIEFADTAPEALRSAVADGMLTAGQRMTDSGKSKKAVPIYEYLLASNWPRHARLGAFYGMAYAQPSKAPTRLIKALGGPDPVFRDMAAQIVAETSGKRDTKRYAAALPSLPPGGQAALLRGLTDRAEGVAARRAVVTAMGSSVKPVKVAAIRALGTVGDDDDVTILAPLLASEDAEIVEAAKESLHSMEGDNVDAAIAAALADVTPAIRAALLGMLADRMASQAVPAATDCLTDQNSQVRIAALRALVTLGGPSETPAIIAALAKATDETERTAAAEAMGTVAGVYKDEVLRTVLGAMDGANTDTRIALVRALGQIGSPTALESVVAAAGSSDGAVSDETVRVLANWRGAEAAPYLLDMIKGEDVSRRNQALRGYVRLARDQKSIEKKMSMLTEAMALADSAEEKWLVLAAWGTLPTVQALDALRPNLDDDTVRNEAASAIISVARELGKNEEGKGPAVDALKTVLDKCQDEAIRDRAQRALAALGG